VRRNGRDTTERIIDRIPSLSNRWCRNDAPGRSIPMQCQGLLSSIKNMIANCLDIRARERGHCTQGVGIIRRWRCWSRNHTPLFSIPMLNQCPRIGCRAHSPNIVARDCGHRCQRFLSRIDLSRRNYLPTSAIPMLNEAICGTGRTGITHCSRIRRGNTCNAEESVIGLWLLWSRNGYPRRCCQCDP
jgi:hypothetical protein